MSLKNKKVLLGLTGGIACYKIPYLVRYLTKAGAKVKVVMTKSAAEFITPLTMETVSENPVALEMFEKDSFIATRHIDLANWADLNLIAPSTANFLGKIAGGLSDDLLSTIICATPQPVMFAPAMNPTMWSNGITQKNVKSLRENGYLFIDPVEGDTACHHYGVGRVAEPEQIFEQLKLYFEILDKKKILAKKKILVTAGPTREAIDPVRYLTNHSSGKMGYAIAETAALLGASITLISGPVNLPEPKNINYISILSTKDLYEAVKTEFKNSDCLIMAAAPSDYSITNISPNKIKKSKSAFNLPLTASIDILKAVAKQKKAKQKIVGFALETENHIANARKKLKQKNLDMIVVNQVGPDSGFNSNTNKVDILMPGKKDISLPLMTKKELSLRLLEILAPML